MNLASLAADLEHGEIADRLVRHVGVNRCLSAQSLTHMAVSMPTIMIPLVGVKKIILAEQHYEAGPGDYLILPPGAGFDVMNLPDLRKGRYLGAVLVFDTETVALFRNLYGQNINDWRLTPQWRAHGTDELYSAIREWVIRNRTFPADVTQTRHRMAEILLLIARQGAAGNLLFQQQPNVRDRAKHLLALNPSHDWRVAEVSRKLGQSESTLRRQLRAEGIGFRDLLEEVRLERGVDQVLLTDMPIGQIAFDCGYQSQSRFSERFRLRFSMSPTELRATQRAPSASIVAFGQSRATN